MQKLEEMETNYMMPIERMLPSAEEENQIERSTKKIKANGEENHVKDQEQVTREKKEMRNSRNFSKKEIKGRVLPTTSGISYLGALLGDKKDEFDQEMTNETSDLEEMSDSLENDEELQKWKEDQEEVVIEVEPV